MQNDAEQIPADRRIDTSRRVSFAPAQVFEAFRDPAVLAVWWGPDGFTNTFYEFDFRQESNAPTLSADGVSEIGNRASASGAQTGAPKPDSVIPIDADLSQVINSWSTLTPAVRASIMALAEIKSAVGGAYGIRPGFRTLKTVKAACRLKIRV